MKRLFALLAALIPVWAGAYEFNWFRTYNNANANLLDQAFDVRVDSNQNVYVLGGSRNQFGHDGVAVIKYSSTGLYQWTYRLDRSDADIVWPYLDTDPFGNLYIACTISTGGGAFKDLSLQKVNGNGQKQWEQVFSAPSNNLDETRDLKVDSAGNAYVLGECMERYLSGNTTITQPNIVVFGFNTNGSARWVDTYTSYAANSNPLRPQNDYAKKLTLDPDGNVITVGYSDIYLSSSNNLVIFKTNSATGSRVWTRLYTGNVGQTFFNGIPEDVTTDAAGNVITTGSYLNTALGDADFFVIKHKYDSTWMWTRYYDGAGNNFDGGNRVITDSAGTIYAAGEASLTANNGTDAVVWRYGADGSPLPLLTYGQGPNGMEETFNDIKLDAAGNIHAAGLLGYSGDNKDYFGWVRWTPAGASTVFRYRSTILPNTCRQIAFGSNGDTYLAGSYGQDFLTIKLIQEPIVVADGFSAFDGVPVTFSAPGVMANDYFSVGGLVTLVIGTTHGSLSLNSNGGFTYTSNVGYVGTDTFTYRVAKGTQTSGNALATITVASLLSSISVTPASVAGGASATGAVTIGAPAGAGGVAISLSSNNTTFAHVPSSVTIPAGQTQANFAVTTSVPSVNQNVTLTAQRQSVTRTTPFTVRPVELASLTAAPVRVTGGTSVVGTVTLTGPANGPKVITLGDTSTAVAEPGTVTVLSGAKTATFTITTVPVTTSVAAYVSATLGPFTKTALVLVQPPIKLNTLTINPSTVKGGNMTTGTVTTNVPAATPISVALSDNLSVVTTPASVAFNMHEYTKNFTISTSSVLVNTPGTLSASYNGVTKTAAITVTP